MINDRMKVIATQQTQNLVLKGKTIKVGNTIYNVKSPFTFQTGIRYNNLVPNANRNFSNTTTDQRANDNFNFTIFDFSNNSYLSGKTITDNGFKNVIFSSQYDTNGVNIYHSGTSTNINFLTDYLSVKANHKYWCSFNCISHDSRVVGGLVLTNLILIDLTLLGMESISSVEDFNKTDLGKAIQIGEYFPYSASNTIRKLEYNNLVQNGNFADTSWWVKDSGLTFSVENNVGKLVSENGGALAIYKVISATIGHKYILLASVNSASNFYLEPPVSRLTYYFDNNWHDYAYIFDATSSNPSIAIKLNTASGVRGELRCKNVMLIDLTQLGLDAISSTTDFYKTELGQAVRNGLALPYSLANAEIDAIAPLTYIRTKRVDLGTLNWNRTSGVFYAPKPSDYSNGKAICPKYTKSNLSAHDNPNKTFTFNGGDGTSIWIKDNDYTDKNAFKTAMSGVILEYETAEPLELNGIGNNYDTFETKSGKVVSKLIKVNLASLTWTQYETHLFGAQNTQINLVAPSVLPNAICSAYQVVKSNDIRNYQQAITIDGQNLRGIGLIDNSVSSVAQLTSKLANEVMICERSVLEPILETTERSVLVDHRYTNVVDANGNEIDTD